MAKKALPKAKFAVDTTSPIDYKQTKEQREQERRWAAERGLRTLQEADSIKGNRQLMNDIKTLAQEQVKTAQKFCK